MARPRSLGWSARFGAYARLTAGGTEALDIGFETGDRALRALAGRAGSVQFRWRYAGANRARTFALPAGLDGAGVRHGVADDHRQVRLGEVE